MHALVRSGGLLCCLAGLLALVTSGQIWNHTGREHISEGEGVSVDQQGGWQVPRTTLALEAASRALKDSNTDQTVPGKARVFTEDADFAEAVDRGAADGTDEGFDGQAGIEQDTVVTPRGMRGNAGREAADRRLVLVAALVASGFFVLICVIIGMYCMWLHVHCSNHDSAVRP